MNRSLRVRLQALLLAAILAVGGIALPFYDAVAFHGIRPEQHGPVRLEPTQGGSTHLLLCSLQQAIHRSSGLLAQPGAFRFIPVAATEVPSGLSAVHPAAATPTLYRSRAPPARAV
jgi:hypothetical protein